MDVCTYVHNEVQGYADGAVAVKVFVSPAYENECRNFRQAVLAAHFLHRVREAVRVSTELLWRATNP